MRFDFLNREGAQLSGRLELPDGAVHGYALFAHCFTCSKHVIAASVISRRLTQSRFGVLRFDFTGLGNSEGDFSNTNFSSNVADLLSACHALSEAGREPRVLIGHSLGGAAVLKAAVRLPQVKAVVTLAAPSRATHVTRLFADKKAQIQRDGQAEVVLAGRKFTIKHQFLEDLTDTRFLEDLQRMEKALLIMHAPQDRIVPISHAGEIFKAARHPKSFFSLDGADHLLSRREDAVFAADVIGVWAGRYV